MLARPQPAVEQWLSALVPRVRARRVAHGVSRLVAAALGAASLVLLLDAGFALPAWGRGLFLSVWLTAVGVLTWRWVLVPWRGELPLSEVADEVRKQLPELADPLRAAVADSGPADETTRQLQSVEPARAVPMKPVAGLVAGALVAILAAVATAAFVPGTGDRLRRVATPWARASSAQAFRVAVTSGEPVVRRGGPVTLSAYAERLGSGSTTPPEAVLVTRAGPDAPEARTPMSGDGAAFHATRMNVAADFEYRVEIGSARSEWFRVSVLDAVELAPGTAIEITPPDYAKSIPQRTLPTLADLDGLQHGTVALRLKFTQPAAAGHLDWRPMGETKSEMIVLDFTPDRLSASATLPLRASGVLRLVLVREADGKRLRTDTTAHVRVIVDEPPRFEEATGLAPGPRLARPDSRIPITFVALDDLSVASAELQYVVGADDSTPARIPIALTGAGTQRAEGRIDFTLAGKGREGDTIRFRVVVSDNRNVDPTLGPQSAMVPSGWSEIRLSATAPPLEEQDIVCARDAFHEGTARALKELKEAADEAAALDTATAGATVLELDQTVRLNNAREKVRAAIAVLHATARDAALTPALRPLAAAVRDTADLPVRAIEDALRRAETDSPAPRAEAFSTAAANWRAAESKLHELANRNENLARVRLDRLKLRALAEEQTALADSKDVGPEALARQRAVLTRLMALVSESEPLRAGYTAASADEIRRLAADAAELLARFRDLDAAAKQTSADARATLVAGITREQDAIAKRAAVLFAKLDTAARLAGTDLPRADDFRRVAELAAEGKIVAALTEIERHAQALNQLASTFERLTADRADPKVAVRQIALWQDDLLSRLRAAVKAKGGFAAVPDEAKGAFLAEQKALIEAVEAVSLPSDEPVRAARTGALLHTGMARDVLARDGAGAEDAMRSAGRALTQLADRTPPLAERLTSSLRKVEALRPELDWRDASGNTISRVLQSVERQVPDSAACAALAKRLALHVEKQRKLIDAVAALDLPGLGERQARLVAALRTAVVDLQDGSYFDVQASQQWVRREFDRMEQALKCPPGPPPLDVKVDELYRKLSAEADALDRHGPALTAMQAKAALPAVQSAGLLLQPGSAVVPEAPVLLNDAQVALQNAETAFRDAKPDETRRRVRAAVEALGRLSDRLNGYESDLDRVTRLAALRRSAAERPKELFTSDEAGRQLGREADELTYTRVGPNGQVAKKRALDLYAKLRAKSDPDRIGTDLKALATALDELSAKMADIAELTAGTPRPAPVPPTDADEFLPSKPLADALRTLESRQRRLQVQVNNLGAELAGRLKPSATNPFGPLDVAQRSVARDARALANELDSDSAKKAAAAAAAAAAHLSVGAVRPAKEHAEHAANFFRQLSTAGDGKPWGQRATDLVARQDAVLGELGPLIDQPDAAAAQQVARTGELARIAAEQSVRLMLAGESYGPDDLVRVVLFAAATGVNDAHNGLTESAKKAAGGSATEAEKLRAGAGESLRAASAALGALPRPPAGGPGPNEAIRSAERAMRKAVAELDGGNPALAQKAMGDAARALRTCTK
jgi:hypothetical protein